MSNLISLKKISKEYITDEVHTRALIDIDLTIDSGEMVAIMGPSGSGKSTLLNILGLLDKANSGMYTYNNKDISKISDKEIYKFRNEEFSFIFQYFALIKEYTILDNVILPLNVRKMSHSERVDIGKKYLEKMGILDQFNKKPSQLSGGQQQRVAIARALVQESNVILADEPTGALDQKTGEEIMDILKQLNKEGKTIIIITHDLKIASMCNRIITIKDGKIV
ncbi:ABC transporter ATP-binding protein [Clostridium sp.]|uniref:ABC transporter ATP-binding protein n=1 Tax=Clostridium sp. TaxID=1506 RepID=UPI0025C11EEF|nr:ABC transporter ATP-binding protein [Clostridium sp.]